MKNTPSQDAANAADFNPKKLFEDIPNDRWLQEQIDYAKERGLDRFGSPYLGKVTGHFDGHVNLPLSLLAGLKGQRDEQNNVRDRDLSAIKEIMQTTGRLPLQKNGEEYVPFVVVAHDGAVRINEGNHRIMAAAELGWASLPIEIRYYDGGQRAENGPLHPSKVAKYDQEFSPVPLEVKIAESDDADDLPMKKVRGLRM